MSPPPLNRTVAYLIVRPCIWALSSLAGKNSRRNPGPPPVSVLHGHLLQNIASAPDRSEDITLSSALSVFLSALLSVCFCCWLQKRLSFPLSTY